MHTRCAAAGGGGRAGELSPEGVLVGPEIVGCAAGRGFRLLAGGSGWGCASRGTYNVVRGCRAEYLFGPEPTNGTQAHDAMDFELERFMHLYAMNRGILLTPFHNMALMSPQTEASDVDRHTKVFREAVLELTS